MRTAGRRCDQQVDAVALPEVAGPANRRAVVHLVADGRIGPAVGLTPTARSSPVPALSPDPYGQELKQRGQSPFRCERTRPNILSQALCFACVHNRLEQEADRRSRSASG